MALVGTKGGGGGSLAGESVIGGGVGGLCWGTPLHSADNVFMGSAHGYFWTLSSSGLRTNSPQ